MIDYGKGYIEQWRIDHLVTITWGNGADKFCKFLLNIESGEWARTSGNHNRKLPKWVVRQAAKAAR